MLARVEINGNKWGKAKDSRAGSLVKINGIAPAPACLIREKEKTQMNNIRHERGNTTTNSTYIKKLIRQ